MAELANYFAAALKAARVECLLAEHSAIVLERIARGAGETRWYWVRSDDDLDRLCALLSPGSSVSFYFDDRIRLAALDDGVVQILDVVADAGDAVLGKLGNDGLEIVVDFVAGPGDLSEFKSELATLQPVFFGAFPGRDNDGRNAITLSLPDIDGVVRMHPH